MSTSFLSLPPEIRQMVYDLYFENINKQVIYVVRERRNTLHRQMQPILDKAGKASRTPEVALLLSSRKIYNEVVDIVYQECHFGVWLGGRYGEGRQIALTKEVSTFKQVMEAHLSSIQHLDFGFEDLIRFVVPDGVVETDAQAKITCGVLKAFMRKPGNNTASIAERKFMLTMLRSLAEKMTNVTTITVHRFELLAQLVGPSTAETLVRIFPNVEKIYVVAEGADGNINKVALYDGEFLKGGN